MIVENFKKTVRVDSENNAYEFLGQIWVKMAHFGANKSFFQLFTLVTSHKISEKFIEWIPRSEQTRFLAKIGAKMTPFRTIVFFLQILSCDFFPSIMT